MSADSLAEGVDQLGENAVLILPTVSDAVVDEKPLNVLLEFPPVNDAQVVKAVVAVLDRGLEPHSFGEKVVENDPV